MDSKELAQYLEATDSSSKPWLLVQLRLKKLQERQASISPEEYANDLADIHQDLLFFWTKYLPKNNSIMNLGEWWRGIEDEVF